MVAMVAKLGGYGLGGEIVTRDWRRAPLYGQPCTKKAKICSLNRLSPGRLSSDFSPTPWGKRKAAPPSPRWNYKLPQEPNAPLRSGGHKEVYNHPPYRKPKGVAVDFNGI
jgi:hypothetical protein